MNDTVSVIFGDTDGNLLLRGEPQPGKAWPLGTCHLHPSAVHVYDRDPYQETTQIPIETLLDVLAKIGPAYDDRPMVVYLPRMSANLFDESQIQTSIRNTLPNAKIICV